MRSPYCPARAPFSDTGFLKGHEMERKRVENVIVDWRSEKSIRRAEKKKLKLECSGYTLSETFTGLDSAIFVYTI